MILSKGNTMFKIKHLLVIILLLGLTSLSYAGPSINGGGGGIVCGDCAGIYEPADATIIKQANILDEDDFASDSDVYPPSQQSTKVYVDTQAATKANTSHGSQHNPDGADPVHDWVWGGAVTVGDATPEVQDGYVYDCTGATAITITNFVDSDGDHSEFTAGQTKIRLVMNSGNVIMDFSDNTNIEGNANTDFTGSTTQIVMLEFKFIGTRWQCLNLNSGFSDPTTLSIAPWWEIYPIMGQQMNPDGTNCTAVTSAQINSGPKTLVSDCDDDADGSIQFVAPMPNNWDGADASDELKLGITWVMYEAAGTNTETVIWKAKVQARGDGETVNNTWSSVFSSTTTFGASEAQYDTYYTEISIAEAVNGSGGDSLFGTIVRDTVTGSDAHNVYVTGVKLYYKATKFDVHD